MARTARLGLNIEETTRRDLVALSIALGKPLAEVVEDGISMRVAVLEGDTLARFEAAKKAAKP